jgi:hypothetical protein
MSCIAFGLSPSPLTDLRDVQIHFSFASSDHAVVHAWIVQRSDPLTTFISGSQDATFRVPSTAADVVCVAGAMGVNRVWPESSRGPQFVVEPTGPMCRYYWRDVASIGPHLAHQVLDPLTRLCGTSFAAPRACAATAMLHLGGATKRFSGVSDFVDAIVGPGRVEKNWRTGFGIAE